MCHRGLVFFNMLVAPVQVREAQYFPIYRGLDFNDRGLRQVNRCLEMVEGYAGTRIIEHQLADGQILGCMGINTWYGGQNEACQKNKGMIVSYFHGFEVY
jgi:hypothetical protein